MLTTTPNHPDGEQLPTLVLVTDAPGSGKTTLAVPLARHLGLPLITKDTIKEALFDTLGTGDHTWSQRLGAASFQVMFALARHSPAAVRQPAQGGPAVGAAWPYRASPSRRHQRPGGHPGRDRMDHDTARMARQPPLPTG